MSACERGVMEWVARDAPNAPLLWHVPGASPGASLVRWLEEGTSSISPALTRFPETSASLITATLERPITTKNSHTVSLLEVSSCLRLIEMRWLHEGRKKRRWIFVKVRGWLEKRHQTEPLCGITTAVVSCTQIVRLSKELGWINMFTTNV